MASPAIQAFASELVADMRANSPLLAGAFYPVTITRTTPGAFNTSTGVHDADITTISEENAVAFQNTQQAREDRTFGDQTFGQNVEVLWIFNQITEILKGDDLIFDGTLYKIEDVRNTLNANAMWQALCREA